MSKTIRRVAQAMCRDHAGDLERDPDALWHEGAATYLACAESAIRALRWPSQDMVDAAHEVLAKDGAAVGEAIGAAMVAAINEDGDLP